MRRHFILAAAAMYLPVACGIICRASIIAGGVCASSVAARQAREGRLQYHCSGLMEMAAVRRGGHDAGFLQENRFLIETNRPGLARGSGHATHAAQARSSSHVLSPL